MDINQQKEQLKLTNLEQRTREHLLLGEVEAMLKAAKVVGRYDHRARSLILLAYRHGLRISEVVALRWEQVDFSGGTIYINRLKHGISATHPLRRLELRALRQLQREYPDSSYFFMSERGAAIVAATVRGIIGRAGVKAGLPIESASAYVTPRLRFIFGG